MVNNNTPRKYDVTPLKLLPGDEPQPYQPYLEPTPVKIRKKMVCIMYILVYLMLFGVVGGMGQRAFLWLLGIFLCRTIILAIINVIFKWYVLY